MGLLGKKKKENSAVAAPQEETKKIKRTKRIPKDVMDSIPFRGVTPSGIIEDYDGRYSKTYRIREANFDTEEEEKQEAMVVAYESLLNSIDEEMIGQLTIINRSIDQDMVRNSILMHPKSDGQNDLRDEWNTMFLDQLGSGKNNLSKDKLFTISVKADNIREANDTLKRIDRTVAKNIRKINHQDTPPLSIEERLALFYDIYNFGNTFPFHKKIEPILKDGSIDWNLIGRHGMHAKELIAPDSMRFDAAKAVFGDDIYVKTFYIDRMPTQLSTSLLNDISDLPCNMITSVTFVQMDQKVAKDLIKNQNMGLNAQINKQQQEGAKDMISNAGVVSLELEHARDQAAEMMQDILKRNQKVFKVTPLVTIFAHSEAELKQLIASLKGIVAGHLCHLRPLNQQTEAAFNTSLPLAQMSIEATRVLTTESAAVYIPFSVQDMNQLDGICYGINPLSGNMIRYNRKNGANYNAAVFGASGSGKSFIVKEEIAQSFLNSDDCIIILDPEGEYVKLGKRFGATIIDIALDGKSYINPMDMDMQYGGEGENPIPMKCDALESLVECMIGGSNYLSPIDKSIIQRVGRRCYVSYYNHMKELLKKGITCDKAAMPTLQDFYSEMTKQPEPQAQYLATAIESYCVGNYSIFAERTNVDTDNRMIIYNLKNMTSGMKELAMHVCMNDAWNHIIQNGMKGAYTRLYVDEFHLFTKSRTSSSFMQDIFKRARKWKGMPLILTQDINDMLQNDESEAILNNCSFIILMNQSPICRSRLREMYSISDQLLEYITDQPTGTGLVYNGNTMIPMENEFNPNTKMFSLMDSRIKAEDAPEALSVS